MKGFLVLAFLFSIAFADDQCESLKKDLNRKFEKGIVVSFLRSDYQGNVLKKQFFANDSYITKSQNNSYKINMLIDFDEVVGVYQFCADGDVTVLESIDQKGQTRLDLVDEAFTNTLSIVELSDGGCGIGIATFDYTYEMYYLKRAEIFESKHGLGNVYYLSNNDREHYRVEIKGITTKIRKAKQSL